MDYFYTIWILIFPLTAFVVLALFGNNIERSTAGNIGTIGTALITILSYYTAFIYFTGVEPGGSFVPLQPLSILWLSFSEHLNIHIGILLDPLSVMMLVVITTVSLMVHIYSLGYMRGERGFQRYYAFLALFTFSMLGLVVATNIFQMYIFWELV